MGVQYLRSLLVVGMTSPDPVKHGPTPTTIIVADVTIVLKHARVTNCRHGQ